MLEKIFTGRRESMDKSLPVNDKTGEGEGGGRSYRKSALGTSNKVGPWQTISLLNDHSRATFSAHTCSPDCVAEFPFSELKTPASPPLQTPILHCGWTRTRVKHSQGGRRRITYTAPCGRKLRDLSEVSNMAQTTFEMSLNVW